MKRAESNPAAPRWSPGTVPLSRVGASSALRDWTASIMAGFLRSSSSVILWPATVLTLPSNVWAQMFQTSYLFHQNQKSIQNLIILFSAVIWLPALQFNYSLWMSHEQASLIWGEKLNMVFFPIFSLFHPFFSFFSHPFVIIASIVTGFRAVFE